MGVFQKNNNYWIDYYVNGRRMREKIGTSKKLAETVLRKRKVEIAENRHLDIKKNAKIKFEDFAITFLNLHSKLNKKSWRRDEGLIKNLSGFLKGKYLYEITPMLIEQYKVERRKQVSKARKKKIAPATVNRELACLKCIFNKAIEWGKIEDNPVRKVKLFKEDNCIVRHLEKEEIGRLINACCDHLKPIVILALNTGMRKGEILGLKWKNIDIQNNIIYLIETKNGKMREVPINDVAKHCLISVRKNPISSYVFCKKNGSPYSKVNRAFFTALKKAGIINFRFHDLRHTYASQLVMLGIDIRTVQELMGHRSIEMTLRYAHLSPSHKKHAVDVLGKQMVTIWSPRVKQTEISKDTNMNKCFNTRELSLSAPVAQKDRASVS